MGLEIYQFSTYKDYLSFKLGPDGMGRGAKTQLADFLPCQSGFISQVLNGDAQFSLEHAIRIAKFLSLPPKEEEYFMLLVHFEKAGSPELQDYYKTLIGKRRKDKETIRGRINAEDGPSLEDQAKYYSNWVYAAVHMASLIPEINTIHDIANRLRVEIAVVNEAVDFLEKAQILKKVDGRLRSGKVRIHLDKASYLINKHHANWRVEALKAIDQNKQHNKQRNLHYSSVFAMSRDDFEKIRTMVLDHISSTEEVLRPSPEEDLFVMNIDFFRL